MTDNNKTGEIYFLYTVKQQQQQNNLIASTIFALLRKIIFQMKIISWIGQKVDIWENLGQIMLNIHLIYSCDIYFYYYFAKSNNRKNPEIVLAKHENSFFPLFRRWNFLKNPNVISKLEVLAITTFKLNIISISRGFLK